MSEHIEIETAGGIQIIRMNRADKKNALTDDMYATMSDALASAEKDKALKVSVFLGVPGAFSAGNDIGDFLKVAMSGSTDKMSVFSFLKAIITSKKPLVAGVDGLAIGIGTTMLMHCDYVAASDRSVFKTPFTDLGLVPEAGSSLIGPQNMGYHRAFELLAMGESFTAEAAQVAGFVNRVTTESEVEKTAISVASAIAEKPVEALAISRQLLRGDRSDVLKRMRDEAELWGARLASDEAKQAFMSFVSKSQKKAS